jgi:hypothetical protein
MTQLHQQQRQGVEIIDALPVFCLNRRAKQARMTMLGSGGCRCLQLSNIQQNHGGGNPWKCKSGSSVGMAPGMGRKSYRGSIYRIIEI